MLKNIIERKLFMKQLVCEMNRSLDLCIVVQTKYLHEVQQI